MNKSEMGKSIDAVRSLTDRDVEGSDQKALPPKVVSSPFWGHMGRSASVAGRLSRTLSRTFSLVDLDDVLYGEVAADRAQGRIASRLSKRRSAAAAAALLLAALMLALVVRPSGRAATQPGSAAGVAQYLRGIAAWYDGQPKSPGAPAYDFYFGTCAKQVQLPAIELPRQLPMAQTWQPDGVYPPDPLDELALNCSALRDHKACNAALDVSNSYEGDLPPLDPEDLAAHSMVPQNVQDLDAAQLDPLQDLDRLNLDCTADPAACTTAAEQSNSYSEGDAADADGFDPIAEAEAYLYMAQAPSGWDAIIGHAAQQKQGGVQQPAGDNSYDAAEHVWVQKRIAEEAAPQYMATDLLDLDCGDEEADAVTANECERSREVNRYEHASQHTCPTELQIQFQRTESGMRTIGYDVPCVDVKQIPQAMSGNKKGDQAAKKPGCGCGAHNADATQPQESHSTEADAEAAAEPEMPAERLQALQLQLQQIAKQRRVTGYDVPALDGEQKFALLHSKQQGALEDPAAAVVGVIRHSDELLQARMYYKNPCNDPGAHQYFKNRRDGPTHRLYYKNSANAPVVIDEQVEAPKQQAPASCSGVVCKAASAAAAALPSLLGVVVAIIAAAAGNWYIKARGYRSKVPAARIQLRERLHAGSRCFSSLANFPIYEEGEEEGDTGEITCGHSSSSKGISLNPSGSNLLVSRLGSEVVPISLPNPSLYTCASTIHESLFESAGDAAAATGGALSSLATVRTAHMDDVPEPGMDSPRNARSSMPLIEKKILD